VAEGGHGGQAIPSRGHLRKALGAREAALWSGWVAIPSVASDALKLGATGCSQWTIGQVMRQAGSGDAPADDRGVYTGKEGLEAKAACVSAVKPPNRAHKKTERSAQGRLRGRLRAAVD
jgi:hypothetical protein